jgi:hypothetical protein
MVAGKPRLGVEGSQSGMVGSVQTYARASSSVWNTSCEPHRPLHFGQTKNIKEQYGSLEFFG